MLQIFTLNVLVATIVTSASSLTMTAEWAKYQDPNNQFEVLMPDTVTEHVSLTDTPVGPLQYRSYVSFATGSSGNAHYIVSYCAYPEGTLHQDSSELVEMFFDETVAGAVEAVGGELIYKEAVNVRGYPAMIWKIQSESTNLNIRSKALVVDNIYYCLQVSTSEASSLVHDGERFFDSFKLLD